VSNVDSYGDAVYRPVHRAGVHVYSPALRVLTAPTYERIARLS